MATPVVLAGLLAACGQKGPLYLPGVEHPPGVVVRYPVPASAAASSATTGRPATTMAPPDVPVAPASPVSSPTSSTGQPH